ncbi:MAG: response regulator transcription factor [Rhizomicrobium sp.]
MHLIFIIEDDDEVRISARALLESAGYAVEDYVDAEQLLKAGRASEAGCLVLDYNLPRMTGIQLLEKLRSQGLKTPAIVVTASDKQWGADIKKLNITAVLRKPMAAEALLEWLARVFAPPVTQSI